MVTLGDLRLTQLDEPTGPREHGELELGRGVSQRDLGLGVQSVCQVDHVTDFFVRDAARYDDCLQGRPARGLGEVHSARVIALIVRGPGVLERLVSDLQEAKLLLIRSVLIQEPLRERDRRGSQLDGQLCTVCGHVVRTAVLAPAVPHTLMTAGLHVLPLPWCHRGQGRLLRRPPGR